MDAIKSAGGVGINMLSDQAILTLVDSIYAAAGDPARWTEILQRLAALLGGTAGTIHHQDTSSKNSSFSSLWNIAPEAIAPYTEYYGALNPLMVTRPGIIQSGAVNTSQMLCPDEIYYRCEYYQDYMRLLNLHDCVAATLRSEGANSSNITIFRPVQGEPFGEAERKLLLILMPHLQRAFQLHSRIQGLEAKGGAALDALDCLEHGVILIDAKGKVLFVNGAARELFDSDKAVMLTTNGLVTGTRSENRQLMVLLQGVLTGDGLRSGGAMNVSRGTKRKPLQILVTPLRMRRISAGDGIPAAAIFISDPDRKDVSQETIIAQLYGLTKAEARLAVILASGESLGEAGDKLGVAQSTLRSQLKSIFAKTNTNRQSELVRLALMIPAVAAKARIGDKNVLR